MATNPQVDDHYPSRRSPATAADAVELGLDPKGCDAAQIDRMVREERGRRWKEDNREALESWNRWIEKNGLPLEKYRVW